MVKKILTFVICHVLGRGTFAVVEKCKYKNNIVAVKKLHSNLPQNVTNIFTKEALLLQQISSKNVVKILGVCENPISIMMEHLEFSFVPFGRDIKVNSLVKLLDVFDSENLLQPYTLVQFLFQHEEHNVIKLIPHGDSKNKRPYRRLLRSTLDVLKDSKTSAKKPK